MNNNTLWCDIVEQATVKVRNEHDDERGRQSCSVASKRKRRGTPGKYTNVQRKASGGAIRSDEEDRGPKAPCKWTSQNEINDKLKLVLLDGFGYTVVDVPQGYLHG